MIISQQNRRDFLKRGGLISAALGLNLFSPAILQRQILHAQESKKRLIFIFQRGGNDGVNTVIPRGDSEYNNSNRPTLYIPQGNAIDLGNGFAQLHPALAPMMDIYNHSDLNQTNGPGNLAILHRIGYSGQTQSHFDSQQFWENGMPGSPDLEEGMLYRFVEKTLDPANNRLVAAALSNSQMVALKGEVPIPTINNTRSFTFSGSNANKVSKLRGQLPSAPRGGDGKGLLGLFGGPRDFNEKPYRDLVYGTGLALTDAIDIVQTAVAEGAYSPSNGAVYPNTSLGRKLQEVAMLIKRTPVQVLGVNKGGWDTHTNQGQLGGRHGELLQDVAESYRALYYDLMEHWNDLVIVTMTEFGRTSKENGSRGTDHAYACVMFVAGGGIKGGVYNCDSGTWADGDMFSQRDRYVRRKTDYRSVFGEIFMNHFGNSIDTVKEVIPSYEAAQTANPGDFTSLGFI